MENWKPIEGFAAYEVSDLGAVRRKLPGAGTNTVVGKILKAHHRCDGYLTVALCLDGKAYTKRVHRLVAEAFVPNPLNLPEVNHKGEKEDNRASKLEWRSKAGHGYDIMRREQRGIGVTFDKTAGRWKAYYKRKHIGNFSTKEEAIATRRAVVKALPEVL